MQYVHVHSISVVQFLVTEIIHYRLKRKVACKIRDEHSLVKDLPPPNETVAKMAAKHLPVASAKQGIRKNIAGRKVKNKSYTGYMYA